MAQRDIRPFLYSFLSHPLLPHVDHSPDAVPLLHRLERVVNFLERLAVRDELVHLEIALQVVVDEARELCAALDATKRGALPHSARDELERCGEVLAVHRKG